MKPKVYIETTVVSYLTARPSRDVVTAGHQQITQQWWQDRRESFELVTSDLVIEEASSGDPLAARDRLDLLATIGLLKVGEDASALAEELVKSGAIPASAAADAMHVSIAVGSGAEYLLTWNCRHLANAAMRWQIDEVCRAKGFRPVIICTPEELLEA